MVLENGLLGLSIGIIGIVLAIVLARIVVSIMDKKGWIKKQEKIAETKFVSTRESE